jgi:hypothetical protein
MPDIKGLTLSGLADVVAEKRAQRVALLKGQQGLLEAALKQISKELAAMGEATEAAEPAPVQTKAKRAKRGRRKRARKAKAKVKAAPKAEAKAEKKAAPKKKSRRGRKRAKRGQIPELINAVLADAGKALGIDEIMKGLDARGFTTTSKNPRELVRKYLLTNPDKWKVASRGKYTLA